MTFHFMIITCSFVILGISIGIVLSTTISPVFSTGWGLGMLAFSLYQPLTDITTYIFGMVGLGIIAGVGVEGWMRWRANVK